MKLFAKKSLTSFFCGKAAAFSTDFSLEILEAPPLHGDDKEEIAEIEVHGVKYGQNLHSPRLSKSPATGSYSRCLHQPFAAAGNR